jgi:hypothetical protein
MVSDDDVDVVVPVEDDKEDEERARYPAGYRAANG